MRSVIIDGVRYIPAKEAVANEKAIARGLLMQFWGIASDEDIEEMLADGDVYVYVNDEGKGVKLRNALDDIAAEAE